MSKSVIQAANVIENTKRSFLYNRRCVGIGGGGPLSSGSTSAGVVEVEAIRRGVRSVGEGSV